MIAKILRNELEYETACNRVYNLINNSDELIDPKSIEGEEMSLLALLIEKYELENYSIGAPNPVEAIKFRMEQMSLKQIDIAPLFGGKTRISEVLNLKRPLTLKMIVLLNKYLGIPLESLIIRDKKIDLEVGKQKEILKVPAIYNYLKDKIALL
jgi:HTH-type transcriptional regulator/antitoxin HigA